MNYIYDVVLNFHAVYYDFFEWDKNDNILNVRKIPIYKVNDNTYKSLKYNDVTVNKDFIATISHYASIYLDDNTHNNICLVTNGKEVLGLSFNDEGKLEERSSLLFDEEQEIIEDTIRQPQITIKFQSNNKQSPILIGRIEQEKTKYLTTYLSKLNPTKDSSLLNYLYYEYHEEEPPSTINIKEHLLKELSLGWNTKLNNIYDLTLLLNQNDHNQLKSI